MSVVAPLPSNNASERCVSGAPLKVKLKEIPKHYYMHYRERKHWDNDKCIAPITEEEIKFKRYESFQCKICDAKFRVRDDNPNQARSSFIYHFAIGDGKIVDAMMEDPIVDMEPVLDILQKHNVANLRQFIPNGTTVTYSGGPCIARDSCDWKIRDQKENGGKGGSATSKTNNMVRLYNVTKNRVNPLACPFNDLDDCKKYVHEKKPEDLKLHLFKHYIGYWKTIVPEMSRTEVKCKDCARKITGETLEACRNSMICHRALHHDELKKAIEEDLREFNADLFDRLFNPEAVKPPRVMYSKSSSVLQQVPRPFNTFQHSAPILMPNQAPVHEKPVVASRSNNVTAVKSKAKKITKKPTRKKAVAQVLNQPAKSKKVIPGWFDNKESDTDSEDEDDPIPTQPYVRPRLKQDLGDLNLSDPDDSDNDKEFIVKKKAKVEPRALPKRSKRPTSLKASPDSDEDWT